MKDKLFMHADTIANVFLALIALVQTSLLYAGYLLGKDYLNQHKKKYKIENDSRRASEIHDILANLDKQLYIIIKLNPIDESLDNYDISSYPPALFTLAYHSHFVNIRYNALEEELSQQFLKMRNIAWQIGSFELSDWVRNLRMMYFAIFVHFSYIDGKLKNYIDKSVKPYTLDEKLTTELLQMYKNLPNGQINEGSSLLLDYKKKEKAFLNLLHKYIN